MVKDILKTLKTAASYILVLSFILGIVYPSMVTILAQALFPWQANGSLIQHQGKTVGSLLIGQNFMGSPYFWGRPSATSDYPYNASSSSGSNLALTNPDFLKIVKERIKALQKAHSEQDPPGELITASGSGLDPHISPRAAFYQVPRIAKQQGLSEEKIRALITQHQQNPQYKLLGHALVNVLLLNLELIKLHQNP